jgi:hypothetical protein
MMKQNLEILITAFSVLFLSFAVAGAQTSIQFLTSWQAQSYAPSWYQGKILPVKGTPTEISFELIDNGKIADLSKTKVRWYVNDKLVKNEEDGLGIKSLSIVIPDYAAQETEIKVAVVNYLGGETFYKTVKIPVVAPEAVIDAPYSNGEISAGSSVFKAVPFFFNINSLNELSVEWSTSEQKTEGDSVSPWSLNLNIEPKMPSDSEINLSLSIKNILEKLEFAAKSIKLRIK